jgi:hypothetical protein
MKSSSQLVLAGFLTFVAAIAWNVHYSLLALASPPHTYDGPLMIGGYTAGAGILVTLAGLRGHQSGR